MCVYILYVCTYTYIHIYLLGFPGGSVVKNPPANVGDMGSIPGLERPLEEGNDNPLQYSCLGSPTNRGAWMTTVHGVAKESDSTYQLNNNSEIYIHIYPMVLFSGEQGPIYYLTVLL